MSALAVSTLAENEAIIERGLATFVEVGDALTRIRDERQYREAGFGDFESYCRERWGFERAHAYRLMDAAEVVGSLSPIGDIPRTESQARELVSILREEGAEAAAAVLEEAAARGPLTARSIAEVVAERKPATTRELLEQSDSNEWYTPEPYLESARRVMGGIDLDPASSETANGVVCAGCIYTVEDDGLLHPWSGRVWLNPPYGGLVAKFAVRIREQYESGCIQAGVLLVNSHPTETKWFQALLRKHPVCFTDHRINFTNDVPDEPGGGSTHGSAFIYLGPDATAFRAEFSQYGAVMVPSEQ